MVIVIAVLSAFVLANYQAARAKERDKQRIDDITAISTKLETYSNEKNAYPATFTGQELFGLDENNLKDPDGRLIVIHPAVADASAAQQVANPTEETPSYLYVPYPIGCTNEANNCTGFVLKSYIEKPTNTTPNPFVKVGTNNL